MPAPLRRYNLGADNFPLFYIVNFKLFGVPEMLKNFSVFICHCDFHKIFSLQQIGGQKYIDMPDKTCYFIINSIIVCNF